jgi:hypothetical protein
MSARIRRQFDTGSGHAGGAASEFACFLSETIITDLRPRDLTKRPGKG